MKHMTSWSFGETLAFVSITVFVIVILHSLHSLYYDRWRQWRVSKRVTTWLGMVRVTSKDIRCWSWEGYPSIVTNELPPSIQLLLRKHGSVELARLSVDLIDPSKASDETRRGVTVACALYGFQMPHRLLLLDDLTAAYLKCAAYDLFPVYVSTDPLGRQQDFQVANSAILTNIGVSSFAAQLPKIASVLIQVASHDYYPGFKAFAAIFNQNLNKRVRNTFTDDEIRSMVTAYAILTLTRIPRSYVLLDSITKAIIAQPFPYKRPLAHAIKEKEST